MTLPGELAILGGSPIRGARASWPKSTPGDEAAVLDVLRSGRWAISGPYVGQPSSERLFANRFAEFLGVSACTPTVNGTAALTIALLALGVGPGDEVLVPGLTWVACASAVFATGAVPILVDIELDSLCMSVAAAKKAITPRTRAILLVHAYCRIADLDGFLNLCRISGAQLIEDCSQSHGSRWNGARTGSFGKVGCFSMQQSKLLTCGEGGAAVTSNAHLADRLEQLRSDGRRFTRSPQLGELELVEIGTVQGQNFCLSEIHAALLLSRLENLDLENAKREATVLVLEDALAGISGVEALPRQPNTAPSYFAVPLRFDRSEFSDASIDSLARALTAELGVRCSPLYDPLSRHCLYQPLTSSRVRQGSEIGARLEPSRFELPNAERARTEFLSLPHWILLEDGAADDIMAAIEKLKNHSQQIRALPALQDRQAF